MIAKYSLECQRIPLGPTGPKVWELCIP